MHDGCQDSSLGSICYLLCCHDHYYQNGSGNLSCVGGGSRQGVILSHSNLMICRIAFPVYSSTRVSSGFTLSGHSVHHLSGPNSYALTQIHPETSRSRWCALWFPPPFTFISRKGFQHPNTRIDVRLLGPCFKTDHLKPVCQHPRQSAVLNHSRQHYNQDYNTSREVFFLSP